MANAAPLIRRLNSRLEAMHRTFFPFPRFSGRRTAARETSFRPYRGRHSRRGQAVLFFSFCYYNEFVNRFVSKT